MKARQFILSAVLSFLFVLNCSVYAGDVTIQVDPSDRLMNSVVLGEWATPGNLEGWTGTNVTGLAATAGFLTGTGSAAAPSVQRTNFSGPDLDFGYYDYLQVRIKVPSGFNDDIIFSFGTTVNGGFTSNRQFIIPDANIIKDGQWHSYRLDLGLVVWWRDTLKDLQIKPLGNSGNGQTFYIDYIEVGDLPGDVLLINTDIGLASGETLADCSYMESKHAVFWWSPASYVIDPALNPTVMGRRALRMIEESYQVYCKKLGFVEPFESWDLWRRDGNRYKVNHTTWFGGFWMGGRNGFGWLNIPAGGLWDEGWGNPVPHEFGHVLDGHQINFLAGGHWESHANYLRQAWQIHYAERFPIDQQSQLDLQIYECSNFRQDHGRLIYRDFRIHQALQDYADDLGLNYNVVAQLWFEGVANQTVYDKLATFLPAGYNTADVVAFGLRHWPFLDFADGETFKNQLWSTANNKAWHDYLTGSLLIPSQDKPGWWRVPFERAPEKFAYMYHELVPTDSNVTVELQGFDLLGNTEGWRWSLAAADVSGNVRFSDLWQPGTHSMVINPGETKIYIVVVATPSDTSLNLDYTDNRFPPDKCADRLHYAYEVRIVGATPAKRQLGWTKGAGAYLPPAQGGGWKDNSAYVAPTAWVGPNAMILGTARVENNARVEDYAVVMESAKIQNYAVVSGYAVVRNSAIVRNYAKVRDRSVIQDNSIIEGNAVVEDYTHTYNSTNIKDSAIARGMTLGTGSTIISGTAIADYDLTIGHSISDGVHFSHVPWGDWYLPYYVNSKVKPRGLVASYRIEEPEGQICWDEFGAQHSLLRGNPQRITDSTMNSTVLRLDGIDDYMVLDRSLCDFLTGTFGLWVKPTDNTDRPLLFMGSSATKYLKLALDSAGKAVFTITDGSTTKTVTSTSTIPAGSWSYIAVSLNGSQAAIYVNSGTAQATTATTLVPDDVLGNNAYTSAEGLYVGRDWAGNLYSGDVEDIRFYNVALLQTEIDNEVRRSGDCIGTCYYNQPLDFNNTEAQSGVHNGLERVLEASIFPDTSDDVSYYEGILDSSDERDGSFEGTGFGLDNREILVRLDNVGFWRTGIQVTLGQWQKITVGFNGSIAELYVNDVLRNSTTYSATQNDVAGKNYRIGFAMDTSSVKYYFDGQIKDIVILDRFNIADAQPPTPNPAAFSQSPSALNTTEITMTASTGSDTSGIVKYKFEELTGNPGATSSDWQSSPTYKDSGLQPGTEYIYTVKMKDKYNNETLLSAPVTEKTYYLGDFNKDRKVDINDLIEFKNDWLFEYEPVNPGLVGRWAFDETSGTTAYDSIAGNNGTVIGGAQLNDSGVLTFDGSNDYVSLPIGSLISSLTNCTFATWVNFSNSGGAWQRIFDFGTGTTVNMFLTPRTGTTGPMRFAITTSGGGGEQQATAPSTLPSGMHHVAVTINANTHTITLYLDGSAVATKTNATLTPSSMGVTTNNWLGRSQYNDAYFSGSIDDFSIYNYSLTSTEINNLYHNASTGTSRKTDFDSNGIINFEDFAVFAQNWLQ
jgi:carbonic anhydrase/acetyltransferase-like protein (isoleucine patch superfamily)